MQDHTPANTSMQISQARDQFSQLVNQVYRGETRVLIEKSGIPVAALVSPADLEELQRLDGVRAAAFTHFTKIGQAFHDEPPEVLERAVAAASAEVRAEKRAGSDTEPAHRAQ